MKLATVARVAVVAGLLLAVGCSSNNKGKIEGTKWANQATSIKGAMIPAGVITLDFNADGTLLYKAGPEMWTGKYALGMADNVTFNTDQDLGGRKSNVEKITVNGNTLTMRDSDGTSLIFTKTN